MTRFTGTFVITTEAKYKFEIEAETQESALYQLENEPFSCLSSPKPTDEMTFGVSEVELKVSAHDDELKESLLLVLEEMHKVMTLENAKNQLERENGN
ncbi:hypothetical protein J3U18_00170 [Gilliamella sp. B3482]|uniref:hypothetical protein n=1 Tax=Gilliamella sp. B3482 TaxID=2817991 RepID=UPI00226A30B3|nr:hypothetical protein [Gilliamella sp. B3482]MCX8580108.1 hypothetical protein [Gilliamella sp. B3482]